MILGRRREDAPGWWAEGQGGGWRIEGSEGRAVALACEHAPDLLKTTFTQHVSEHEVEAPLYDLV